MLASSIGGNATEGGGGGDVLIQATQNISIDASFESGFVVNFQAGNDLSVTNQSRIVADTFRFDVGGRMTLEAGTSILASGSGTTILVNANSFTNQAGNAGLQPGAFENAGRYLVYSQSPLNNQPNPQPGTYGEVFGVTFDPANPDAVGIVPAQGNFFLYAPAPAPAPPTPCASCITTVETQDVEDPSDLFELEQRPERPLLLARTQERRSRNARSGAGTLKGCTRATAIASCGRHKARNSRDRSGFRPTGMRGVR